MMNPEATSPKSYTFWSRFPLLLWNSPFFLILGGAPVHPCVKPGIS